VVQRRLVARRPHGVRAGHGDRRQISSGDGKGRKLGMLLNVYCASQFNETSNAQTVHFPNERE
jgi:hypothetical protein